MIRELVGDLVVHVAELAAGGIPYFEPGMPTDTPGRRERYDRFTTYCERLFELALAAGIAAETEPVPPDLVAALAEHADFISEAWYRLDDGLSYIGHEQGYFYGGLPWPELCHVRSALEFLRVMSNGPADLPEEVEYKMARYGIELFEQVAIPPGMPARHWWWFRDSP